MNSAFSFPEPRVNGSLKSLRQTNNYGSDSIGNGSFTSLFPNKTGEHGDATTNLTSPAVSINIQQSLANQTQILNDVSYLVSDNSNQLGTLIPVAWVTLALFLIRLISLIVSRWPKAPNRRRLDEPDVFSTDL